MVELFGYQCYSPAWQLFMNVADLCLWGFLAFVLYDRFYSKRALREARRRLEQLAAPAALERGMGQVWEVGSADPKQRRPAPRVSGR